MDTIFQEDWEKFDYEFKIHVEGCDRDKKPGSHFFYSRKYFNNYVQIFK